MFELDKYDEGFRSEEPAIPQTIYQSATDITGLSFLHWGEHCVECAAPACYLTCDLYQARSDLRCRRFQFGAYKNPAFSSPRGYGVEIRFKKWAKIEAFGDTAIRPVPQILRLERLIRAAAPIGNAVGRILTRLTANKNWAQLTYIAAERYSRWMHRRRSADVPPDAFLLEVYNPDAEAIRLQVIFSPSPEDLHHQPNGALPLPPVVNTISLPSGYSRHQFGAQQFYPFVERRVPFRITIVPEADTNARLVFLTADLVTLRGASASVKPVKENPGPKSIKCVIFDLDNTLWDGTLVETDEVKLMPEFPALLEHFDRRGILMSVVSKNDFEPAWKKLQQLGVADYFLYPQIDWLPKSQKIRSIAKRLNIGIDTLAFVDDSPFELDEVARAVPEITCVKVEELPGLASDPRFQGSATPDARGRRKMYQQELSRERIQGEFGDDYFAFLASCAIVLDISSYTGEESDRVAELVQRTNQLNFSGRKYTRAQMDEVIANPALSKFVLRCSDRYGSYGTVGFCMAQNDPGELEIVDFMLSCRVQGKFIEQALFAHLLRCHSQPETHTIRVNFRRTERNTPAHNVLHSMGFREDDSAQGRGMSLNLSAPMECPFIKVQCSVAGCSAHES